ncbi:hypothetical protein HY989_05530 [Candidatus Micrarchaeota archaeon]|nr:hypothetical protein [Candidatus Micrarchaeota archaeon]
MEFKQSRELAKRTASTRADGLEFVSEGQKMPISSSLHLIKLEKNLKKVKETLENPKNRPMLERGLLPRDLSRRTNLVPAFALIIGSAGYLSKDLMATPHMNLNWHHVMAFAGLAAGMGMAGPGTSFRREFGSHNKMFAKALGKEGVKIRKSLSPLNLIRMGFSGKTREENTVNIGRLVRKTEDLLSVIRELTQKAKKIEEGTGQSGEKERKIQELILNHERLKMIFSQKTEKP